MKKILLLAVAAMLTTATVSTAFAQDKEKCTTTCCKKCSDKCKEPCKKGKCTKAESSHKCAENKSCASYKG